MLLLLLRGMVVASSTSIVVMDLFDMTSIIERRDNLLDNEITNSWALFLHELKGISKTIDCL